jgi:hypothetical protein
MGKVELSAEEVEVLREVISHLINEMEVEVFRTDTHDFKEMLKHRREVLENVLSRLEAVPAQ